ncbi:hypothetical protein COO91_09474 (plasmid) [Nostoc flagelliforme CCNUN1]|uniref:Uncharacterized protein n=1 Tax=Nostoc flagelliforme CCNUN1 TaxID=2038116 RepID=A0A2K8T6K3_9NOSO|nr:hypothetical protein COO91_09474 [Nostoc flagelliforme CCNUN1]
MGTISSHYSVDRKLLEVDERIRVSAVGFETGNHSQLRSL